MELPFLLRKIFVIKVWMSTFEFHDPNILIDIKNLSKEAVYLRNMSEF